MFTKKMRRLLFVLLLALCLGLILSAQAAPIFQINLPSEPTKLNVGDPPTKIKYTVTASADADPTLIFTSDNTDVAVVDPYTGELTGKGVGYANITIKHPTEPEFSVVCPIEVISSSTITLNVYGVTLPMGKTFDLVATINPSILPIYCSSTNPAVCKVEVPDPTQPIAKITALSNGTANIVVANAHGVKAICPVTVGSGSSFTPTPTPTPTPVPTNIPTSAPTLTPTNSPIGGLSAYVNTVHGSLNLRSYPSRLAPVLRTIPQYAPFTVLEYGPTWCKAMYYGTVGYVMTMYVRLSNATPVIPVVTPTPAPIIPTAAPITQTKARVITPSGSLNLRTLPNQSSARILLIPRSAIVDVLSFDYDWCRVQYNGVQGYVMTKFLNLDINQPIPAPVPTTSPGAKYAQVSTVQGGLNMRKSASSSAKRILVIPQNAFVQVLEVGSKWCYVTYNGASGYVMSKYLKM